MNAEATRECTRWVLGQRCGNSMVRDPRELYVVMDFFLSLFLTFAALVITSLRFLFSYLLRVMGLKSLVMLFARRYETDYFLTLLFLFVIIYFSFLS